MPLDNIVNSARTNGVKKPITQQVVQQMESSKKFIDATVGGQFQPVRRGRSTSINAIAKELGALNPVRNAPTGDLSWDKCINLKKSGSQPLCSKYYGFCAQEKCPKRYMDC
ncbi:MAG: hypothetical protein ABID38_03430 [Candidatus Diapherotrites archaeon]